MFKKSVCFRMSSIFCASILLSVTAFAASQSAATPAQNPATSLWELLVSGGSTMIFLGMISVAAVAMIFYQFKFVTVSRLTPADFTENLLALLDKKAYDKAESLCKTQNNNMISGIALKGLTRLPKGKAVVEEAIQFEGKARVENLWQQLSYLGDIAVIAPMLGLLGTILGMIEAFNYQAFKAGVIKPVILAQGLSKAMITTAFGLIIAVPVLVLYSYFRGRVTTITSNAERASTEILTALTK